MVTRLVEVFGRPRAQAARVVDPDQDWTGGTAAGNGFATAPLRRGGWSAQLPARSLDDTWAGDDRWGER
jgi:hypothetical protein